MSFIELNRCFIPIGKDDEPILDIGRLWGREFGGWLDWSNLLKHRRVVLLAEASSGKSEEFRNQTNRLNTEGYPAFFVRIEELCDQGFEDALEPGLTHNFQEWREGKGEGYFFLDAVDEARLNRKSFESSLKRFVRELGRSIERARIFISCRVSDWEGSEDRALVERLIPSRKHPKPPEKEGAADFLLDPIFKEKSHTKIIPEENPEQKVNELLVVQLSPLSTEQYQSFATALGVKDVNEFVAAINRNSLDAFTERPGDLIDLINYWKSYGRFASFSDMVEHSINRKLKESNTYRPDNEVLSPQKARSGAERVAAALTFGKSFTLRTPGYCLDPTLASGAIDPATILEEWTDAERNALLRRGIFAPATYSRIRFHHRLTQEYLTAQWLDRILHSNCPRTEVWDLFFADIYGVETVVPSLRPTAAWLALRHTDFLEEIIRREPLVLLQYGDPGSLPMEARKKLLMAYAHRHAATQITNDSIDHRALWMFAHSDLSGVIRKAWQVDSKTDFRIDLLRLIREGVIDACIDLARGVAFDKTASDYNRIVAIEALVACKDTEALSNLAEQVCSAPANLSARFATYFAKALFPLHLNIEQLFALIEESQASREDTIEGFPYSLEDLYNACPNRGARKEFVTRIAELCLSPPFDTNYQHISMRHFELSKHIEQIAKWEVQVLGSSEPPGYLIRLLMVVERSELGGYHSKNEDPPLNQLVQSNKKLQQALFWADVKAQSNKAECEQQLVRHWQIYGYDERLWMLGPEDLPWLYEDLSRSVIEADQRIALNAIVSIIRKAEGLETEIPHLRELVRKSVLLVEDLEAYLNPPPENEEAIKHRQRMAENRRKHAEKKEQEKTNWVDFQRYIKEHIDLLCNPQFLRSWKAGAYRLWDLTKWLMYRSGENEAFAPCQWRLLEEGFGRQVAEAYRGGMKFIWRLTKPERPTRNKEGWYTLNYMNMLSFGGVCLESEDTNWALRLSDEEAKKATMHGCLTEQGYPKWIETLLDSHFQVVLPILKRCIKHEWLLRSDGRSDFLSHYAKPTLLIHPAIQQILFKTIVENNPNDLGRIDNGLRIIKKLELDRIQIRRLIRVSRRRFLKYVDTGAVDFALRYLAILFFLDPDQTVFDFEKWLGSHLEAEKKTHAERTFAFLFDRHDSVLSDALARASVHTLEKILHLAYSYIHPEHDISHEGGFTPGVRDHAQDARNAILSALLNRSGVDAFRGLQRMADEPEYSLRSERFRELAHGMAEKGSELAAWSAEEVVNFEIRHTAPVKTGSDLLRVVMAVIRNIQFQLDKGDASSRSLLQRAEDEDEVQNWIVEQMNFRSQGRYNAYRESQVADGDKPDIIVSSTSAQCEVALEVKHSGKGWTIKQLERALRKQLVIDYLKPPTRRHGVLVITYHGKRYWRDSETNEQLSFDSLMLRLDKIAKTLVENDNGPTEVMCFGIDASSPLKEE